MLGKSLPREIKGGLLLTANTYLTLVVAFAAQVVVARVLGPETFGYYAFVISFAHVTRIFVDMGVENILIPNYRREQDSRLFGAAWILKKSASLASILLCVLLAVSLEPFGLQRSLSYDIAWVVAAFFFCDHQLFTAWCKTEGHYRDYVAVSFGGTALALALRVGLVLQGASLRALFLTYLVEQAAKSLIAAVLFWRRRGAFWYLPPGASSQISSLFKQAWPLWLSALMSVVYLRLDQFLLGSLLQDTTELGYYSVASRLVEALGGVGVALVSVYLPILAEKHGEEFQKQLQRLHDLAVWSGLLICAPLFLVLEGLVVMLYGAEFQRAGELAGLFLWALPAMTLSQSRAAFLYSRGLQRWELLFTSTSLTANLALNMALIPRFGALGAILSTLGIHWLSTCLWTLVLPSLRPVRKAFLRALLLPASLLRLKPLFFGSGEQIEESSGADHE